MTRKAVILDGAKADFRDVKRYVKRRFGDLVWNEVNQEFKDAIKTITANPQSGTPIEELRPFGYGNYRKTLVRQTRVVYEFDDEELIVHMFIHAMQDFRTHLEQRLLNPPRSKPT